ncbi:uncharacterized protein LOC133201372 [Saccostrea echinata]|uniref:uncharacterized protein LOC133201372 n=1 Tax=Saccostrea echinata TaxID=191078 RepID=UPI002A80109F|nr:uncharacterized protein LOC133201372 [Saccostrea echinata]
MGCSESTESNSKMFACIPPQPPYLGPPCEYRIENFMVEYVEQLNHIFMPTSCRDMPLMTLDENVYSLTLGSLYDLGFRLLTFTVIPASVTVSGILTANIKQTHKYQGICRHLPEDELPQQWSLKVVKSYLPSKIFTYGVFRLGDTKVTADSTHIFQTITDEASKGGRLVCVEVTGYNSQNVKQTGETSSAVGAFGGHGAMNSSFFGQTPDMILGVDIFFEIPRNPSSTQYVYQCVTIPMKITWRVAVAKGGEWNVELDWAEVTSQYLERGWKLIDIFRDSNSNGFQDKTAFTSKVTISQNCVFFFEKEQSKLNDKTPVYEATMIEYNLPGEMTKEIGTTRRSYNPAWGPILDHLGTFGWELVKILDTPALTFKKIMWMFFHRKIVAASSAAEHSSSSGANAAPTPTDPPE